MSVVLVLGAAAALAWIGLSIIAALGFGRTVARRDRQVPR